MEFWGIKDGKICNGMGRKGQDGTGDAAVVDTGAREGVQLPTTIWCLTRKDLCLCPGMGTRSCTIMLVHFGLDEVYLDSNDTGEA